MGLITRVIEVCIEMVNQDETQELMTNVKKKKMKKQNLKNMFNNLKIAKPAGVVERGKTLGQTSQPATVVVCCENESHSRRSQD